MDIRILGDSEMRLLNRASNSPYKGWLPIHVIGEAAALEMAWKALRAAGFEICKLLPTALGGEDAIG